MKTLSISREAIRNTTAFKALPRTSQNVLLNRRNVQAIENGVNVSTNIGFEKWEVQSHATGSSKKIVKELLNLI